MIFCTFYTDDWYRQWAKGLETSFYKFHSFRDPAIRLVIQQMPDRHGHNPNVHQKPAFIKKIMETWEEDVVWIDADVLIRAPLSGLFADLTERPVDVAAYINPNLNLSKLQHSIDTKRELMGGTLYFKDSTEALEILASWETMNRLQPDRLDQQNLQEILERTHLSWRRMELHPKYCWLKNPMKHLYPDVEPVIEHLGVSRENLSKRLK